MLVISDSREAFVGIDASTLDELKARISSAFPDLVPGWRLLRNDRKFVNVDSLCPDDILVIEQKPVVDAEYKTFWDHVMAGVGSPQLQPSGPRNITIKDMVTAGMPVFHLRINGSESERDIREALDVFGCAGNHMPGAFLMFRQKDISHPMFEDVCMDDFNILDGSTLFLLKHSVPSGLPGGADDDTEAQCEFNL